MAVAPNAWEWILADRFRRAAMDEYRLARREVNAVERIVAEGFSGRLATLDGKESARQRKIMRRVTQSLKPPPRRARAHRVALPPFAHALAERSDRARDFEPEDR